MPALPLPGKNPGRNSWRGWRMVQPGLLAGPHFKLAQKAQVQGLSVHCSGFLGRTVDLVDTGVQAQRLPGFSPSSWQVHPSFRGPSNTTSGPPAPAWAPPAEMSPQARPPGAELSPSRTTLISLSQSPYLFLLPPSPPPLPLFSLPSLTSPRMGLPPFPPLRQNLPPP